MTLGGLIVICGTVVLVAAIIATTVERCKHSNSGAGEFKMEKVRITDKCKDDMINLQFNTTIDLIKIADKHGLDRDAIIGFFAEEFVEMCVTGSFKEYQMSEED